MPRGGLQPHRALCPTGCFPLPSWSCTTQEQQKEATEGSVDGIRVIPSHQHPTLGPTF